MYIFAASSLDGWEEAMLTQLMTLEFRLYASASVDGTNSECFVNEQNRAVQMLATKKKRYLGQESKS